MDKTADYKSLITEIVKKQMDILGPEIAVGRARKVKELSVSDDGEVLSFSGDPHTVLQDLVDQYIALSGEIVKNILGPVFVKYPEIKINLQ